MKKTSLWIACLSIFLLIAGCGVNDTSKQNQERQQTIQKNKRVWNKKVQNALNVDQPNYEKYLTVVPNGYKDEDMSLKRLKSGNQLLVEAQVVNLQPEFGRLWETETKATIYIDKVLSGDKTFQGKTIKTEFSGGLTKAKDYFNSVEGQYVGNDFGVKDPKKIVYKSNPTIPMPKIGSKIIVGLNRYQPENKYRRELYKQYGLTTKNFYVVNNPEVTYWVKSKGKYKLNNPAFYKKENLDKYPQLNKITEKLNE